MKAFFSVIFVFLAIIFIGTTVFAGFKALCLRIIERIKDNFNSYKFDVSSPNKDMGSRSSKTSSHTMKVVNITAGQCQSCGRTFIGTTDDEECPLMEVEFMGEQKIICNDCLQKLIRDFNRSEQSDEKWFSKNAQHLKDLLSDCLNKPK